MDLLFFSEFTFFVVDSSFFVVDLANAVDFPNPIFFFLVNPVFFVVNSYFLRTGTEDTHRVILGTSECFFTAPIIFGMLRDPTIITIAVISSV